MPVYHLPTLAEFILKISIQNSYFDQDGMTKEITVLDFRFDKRGTYFEDRLDVISFEVKVRSRDLENSAVLDNLFSVLLQTGTQSPSGGQRPGFTSFIIGPRES